MRKKLLIPLLSCTLLLGDPLGTLFPALGLQTATAAAAETSVTTGGGIFNHAGIKVISKSLGAVNPKWFGANVDYSDPYISDGIGNLQMGLSTFISNSNINELRYGDSYLQWNSPDKSTMALQYDAKNNPLKPGVPDFQRRDLTVKEMDVGLSDILNEAVDNGKRPHVTLVYNQANGSINDFRAYLSKVHDAGLSSNQVDFELGSQVVPLQDYKRWNGGNFPDGTRPIQLYMQSTNFTVNQEGASSDPHIDGYIHNDQLLSNGRAGQLKYIRNGLNLISGSLTVQAAPNLGKFGPYEKDKFGPYENVAASDYRYPNPAPWANVRINFPNVGQPPVGSRIAFSYKGMFPGYRAYRDAYTTYRNASGDLPFKNSYMYISMEGLVPDDLLYLKQNSIGFNGVAKPLVSLYHNTSKLTKFLSGWFPASAGSVESAHQAVMAKAAGYDAAQIKMMSTNLKILTNRKPLYISQFGLNDAYFNNYLRPNSMSGTLYTALEIMNFYDQPEAIRGAAALSLASRNTGVSNNNNNNSHTAANYSLIGYDVERGGEPISKNNIQFFKTGPGLAYDFFDGVGDNSRLVLQTENQTKSSGKINLIADLIPNMTNNEEVVKKYGGIKSAAEVSFDPSGETKITTVYLANMDPQYDSINVPVTFDSEIKPQSAVKLFAKDGSLAAENTLGALNNIAIEPDDSLFTKVDKPTKIVNVKVPKNTVVKLIVTSVKKEQLLQASNKEGIALNISKSVTEEANTTTLREASADGLSRAISLASSSRISCSTEYEPGPSRKRCELLVPREELHEGNTYTYWLESVDEDGFTEVISNEATVTADFNDPTPVGSLAAARVSDTGQPGVKLTWQYAVDNPGSGMKEYRITRDGLEGYLAILDPATLTFTDTYDLHTGQTYTYRIESCDNADNCSQTATSVALAHDTQAPTIPGKPSVQYGLATDEGGEPYPTVTFQWTDSTDNVAVEGYKLVAGGQALLEGVAKGEAYDLRLVKKALSMLSVPVTGADASLQLAAEDYEGNTSAASVDVDVQLPDAPLRLSQLQKYDQVTIAGKTFMVIDEPQAASSVRKVMDMSNLSLLPWSYPNPGTDYLSSYIRSWLNGTYYNGLPSTVKARLKVYDLDKARLLGAWEDYNPNDPQDVAHLAFDHDQWTRSAVQGSTDQVYVIGAQGAGGALTAYSSTEMLNVHPVVYMDGTQLVSGNGSGVYVPYSGITSASVNPQSLQLDMAEPVASLTLNVTPANAENRWVVWGSDNPQVVRVLWHGDVLANAMQPGNAQLYAVTAAGIQRVNVTVTAPPQAPPKPEAFTGTYNDTAYPPRVDLKWQPPAVGETDIVHYVVSRSDDGYSETVPAHLFDKNQPYYVTDMAVQENHTYNYQVVSCSHQLICSAPQEVSVAVKLKPPTPFGFTYSLQTDSLYGYPMELDGWFRPSHYQYDDTFDVYRIVDNIRTRIGSLNFGTSDIGGCSAFGQNGKKPIATCSFADKGVPHQLDKELTYQIYEVEHGVSSDPLVAKATTGHDSTPPSTPAKVSGEVQYERESPFGLATDASFVMKWTASSDNVAVDHYEIWRTTDDGKKISDRINRSTSFDEKGYVEDYPVKYLEKYFELTKYELACFHVVAVDQAGNVSPPSSCAFYRQGITPFSKSLDFTLQYAPPYSRVHLGGQDWIVVDAEGGKTRKLLLEGAANNGQTLPWNAGADDNRYANSSIRTWLNGTFYNSLSDELKRMLVYTSFQPGGGQAAVLDQVGLLQEEEYTPAYQEEKANLAFPNRPYWLLTAGGASGQVRYVSGLDNQDPGLVLNGTASGPAFVRPVIRVRAEGVELQEKGAVQAGDSSHPLLGLKAPQTLDEAEKFTVVRMDGRDWITLDEEGSGTRKLLAKDAGAPLPWNGGGGTGNSQYLGSTVRGWLNGAYYNSLPEPTRNRMVKTVFDLGTTANQALQPGMKSAQYVSDWVGLAQGREIAGSQGEEIDPLLLDPLKDSWLVDPFGTNYAWYVDGQQSKKMIQFTNISKAVHPVITVHADGIQLGNGDGTAANPYTVTTAETLAKAERWSVVRIGGQDWRVIDEPNRSGSSRKLMLKDYDQTLPMAWSAAGNNNYANSDLRQWLNGEFYDNLPQVTKTVITPTTFDLGTSNNQSLFLGMYGERWITDNVGLVQANEYDPSDLQQQKYIAGPGSQWLLSPDAGSPSQAVRLLRAADAPRFGALNLMGVVSQEGIRPVIGVRGDLALKLGSGTEASPYEVKATAVEQLPAWSYVRFAGKTWLTYAGSHGPLDTRLYAVDALPAAAWGDTNRYAASGVRSSLLNWYNSLTPGVKAQIASTTFDLGTGQGQEARYVTDPVGLLQQDEYRPELAEHKAKLAAANPQWLMAPNAANGQEAYYIGSAVSEQGQVKSGSSKLALALHPVVRLHHGAPLAGGSGTASDPFVVSIAVEDIGITGQLRAAVGGTTPLTAAVTPAEATNAAVTWTSLAPEIATVSASGAVTGVKDGVAIVRACAKEVCRETMVTVGGGQLSPMADAQLVRGARAFSGELADAVDAGSLQANFSDGFTWTGWVQYDADRLQANSRGYLTEFIGPTGANYVSVLDVGKGGTGDLSLRYISEAGQPERALTASDILKTGERMQLAITLTQDPAQAGTYIGRIYKNGVLVKEQQGMPGIANVAWSQGYVGRGVVNTANPFKGRMADVSLYAQALSAEDMERQGKQDTLVAGNQVFGATANTEAGYRNLGTAKYDFSGGFTWEGWVQYDASRLQAGSRGYLTELLGTSNSIYVSVLDQGKGGTGDLSLRYISQAGRNENQLTAPGILTTNERMHLAITLTKDPANAGQYIGRIYKNGVMVQEQAGLPGIIQSEWTQAYAGRPVLNAGNLFKGQLADVSLYTRALSEEDIRAKTGGVSLVGGVRTFSGDPARADYGNVGVLNADYSHGLTIEGWVKADTAASSTRIVDFGNGPDGRNILLTREGMSNTMTFKVLNGGSGSVAMFVPNVWEIGKWMHVAITVDASGQATMYKNGLPVAVQGGFPLPVNVPRTNMYVGKSNWAENALFQGQMADLKLYTRALNAAEIQQRWSAWALQGGPQS